MPNMSIPIYGYFDYVEALNIVFYNMGINADLSVNHDIMYFFCVKICCYIKYFYNFAKRKPYKQYFV